MDTKSSDNPIVYSRFGIIGDVHSRHIRLFQALNFLESSSVQAILCVGDIVDGLGNANTCCELLAQHNVLTVLGNHDRWLITNQNGVLPDSTHPEDLAESSKQYLAGLPETRELQTPWGRLLLCHGIGNQDMARLHADDQGYALDNNFELREVVLSNRYRIMVHGHTHRSLVRKFNMLTVINAGSLLYPQEPCMAILDSDQDKLQFYIFDHQEQIQEEESLVLSTVKSESMRTYY
jgi:putative phosphoesterase